MSKYFSTAVTVVVTFIVSLALNTVADYLASENGAISISRPLIVNGKIATAISIDNYSKKFIDGVMLEVPLGVTSSTISADSAVLITDVEVATSQRAGSIKISQISPRHTTTVMVMGATNTEPNLIRVLNASASGLALRNDDQLDSLFARATKLALIAALVQAMFVGAGAFYATQKRDELNNRIDKINGNLENLRRESRDMRATSTKMKILLLARISDYSKELDFWKNFIKERIGGDWFKNKDADKIFDAVTKHLKTFGTANSFPDFEVVKIAAAMLRDNEENFGQQEKAGRISAQSTDQ